MTGTHDILALLRAHTAGDTGQFLSVVEDLGARAGRSGRVKAARDLAAAVSRARTTVASLGPSAGRPVPLRRELSALMVARRPDTSLRDLVLDEGLAANLRRLVREQEAAARFVAKGLLPRRKLLLCGPPGTGKTLTASALAGELGVPLYTVMLDGIMTKFMGETAAKLRLVFDAMLSEKGVYFFDEVDALASSRGADNDVGEARRVLNSFLQFMDGDTSAGLVVAATNLRSHLDAAVFRCFDAVLTYPGPTRDQACGLVRTRLAAFDAGTLDWTEIGAAVGDLSQGEVVAAADDAARTAVLDNADVVTTGMVRDALLAMSAGRSP